MRFLQRIIVIAVALVVCVVLLEVALRLAGWQRSFSHIEVVSEGTPRRLHTVTLHANREIQHTTNEFDVTYTTNSLGYFDVEWAPEAPDSTLRIAYIGDSFPMGHGVMTGERFPKRVESMLRAQGEKVEVLNFGVWGTGTLHQTEFIPDLCALGVDRAYFCFYVNDLLDNERYAKGETAPGEKAAGASVPLSVRLREVLNDHSRAFGFFAERTKNVRDAVGAVTYPLEGVFTGTRNAAIDSAAVYLERACDQARACGIDCAIVYIPARVQVQKVRVPDTFQLDLPQERLRAALPDAAWIDLTPAFRAAEAGGNGRLFLREGHWTPRGHERVAEWLISSNPAP